VVDLLDQRLGSLRQTGDRMADDNHQRSLRSLYARTPMPSSTANDPLAELARLIGQTDPFAEFGRHPQPSAAATPAYQDTQHWSAQEQGYQQPAPAHSDPYSAAQQHPGYDQPQHDAPAYDSNAYYQDDMPGSEGAHDYDDVPPRRSRIGVIAIAAVLGLVVVGTAGAFGYRALFGSSGSAPPPVIKADTAPTKVVPASKSEPQSNKLIYDRVGDRGGNEKIVSREERPIEIKDQPTQPSLLPNALGTASAAQSTVVSASNVGAASADQPKKIHTIVIRPDQPQDAPQQATSAPQRAASARPALAPVPPQKPAAPQRLASAPPVTTADAEDDAPEVRAPASARPASAQAAPSRNAPLSLSPNAAPAPAAARPDPVRTASAPARVTPPAATSTGQYAVQVSSQRSEADAAAAFRSLQGKYPSQLGSRQPIIRRADLGSKGVYYRAMVGPFASASQASELCESLKSAGGSCLIQKN
jgi:hypothetical protein